MRVGRATVVPAFLLLALVTAGCTSGTKADDAATTTAPGSSSPSTSQHSTALMPPALDPGTGEVVAGQQGETRGNASFSYDAGSRGKALIVAVSCRGPGTLKVSVPVLGTDFPLECSTAEPAVTYNQLAMSSAHKAGTVAVTAPSSVAWALTVGRGNAAEEESPTPG
ncbi:hypothetical protein [Streptomyces sp. E2N166]|uniref:hypothetical protein n=1 Tax=Streptomyces sp. E2N166 TaxID=1851909 RepID=UPI001EE7E512|nr:hypothetical protein [Streptomyces sp. E2N166]